MPTLLDAVPVGFAVNRPGGVALYIVKGRRVAVHPTVAGTTAAECAEGYGRAFGFWLAQALRAEPEGGD